MEFTLGGMNLTARARKAFGIGEGTDGVSVQTKAALKREGVSPEQIDAVEPAPEPVDTSGQSKGKSTKQVIEEKYGSQKERQEADKKRLLEKQRKEAEALKAQQ